MKFNRRNFVKKGAIVLLGSAVSTTAANAEEGDGGPLGADVIIQNKSKEYQEAEFTLTNPSGKSVDSKRVGLEGRYRGPDPSDRKAEISVIPLRSGEFEAKVATDYTTTAVTWGLEKGGPGNEEALLVNIKDQEEIEIGKCVI